MQGCCFNLYGKKPKQSIKDVSIEPLSFQVYRVNLNEYSTRTSLSDLQYFWVVSLSIFYAWNSATVIMLCLGVDCRTELGQPNSSTSENAGPQPRSLIHLIALGFSAQNGLKRPKPQLGCPKLPAQLRTPKPPKKQVPRFWLWKIVSKLFNTTKNR